MIKNIWAKISYIWFIIVLFILGFFTRNLVYASETSGYGSAKYIDCSYYIDNRGIVDTSNNRCSDWINFGTEDTYPNSMYRYMYSNNVFITSGNYTWEKGNTYTIKMTLAINPKDYEDFYDSFRVGQFRYEGGTTNQTSSLSEDNLIYGSSSISIRDISNNNYWVEYTLTFIPSKSLKSVWFQILYRGAYDGMEASGRGLALLDFQYYRVDSVTYVEGNDLTQVTDAINQQIYNDNQNTTNIINNQNQNTQSIINNQNQNTQDIINSNKACSIYDLNNSPNVGRVGDNGNIINDSNWHYTDYIKVNENYDFYLLENSQWSTYSCFYTASKSKISCFNNSAFASGTKIDIPTNASYFRGSIAVNGNRPQFKICTNGSQIIDDTLTDDSVDDPSDMLEDFEDLLPSNGVITQLLALPISWYNKILNSLSGTCSSFNLGSLYGTNLIMPCIDLSDYLGSSLVNVIDLMISGFFIIHIAKKMIKAFENFTSMKEGDVIDD